MATCATCGSTILFGGRRDGDRRYCNDRCLESAVLRPVIAGLPEDLVQREVEAVHRGPCPRCGGPGPIDVHVSHRVWSMIFATSWNSRPAVSCRDCGRKRQATDALFCLALGWWGFPWGLIMTPVMVGRNVIALAKRSSPDGPTPDLWTAVRLNMAQHVLLEAEAAPEA